MPVLDGGRLSVWCRSCPWQSQPRAVSSTDPLVFEAVWAAAEVDWAEHACGADQVDTPPRVHAGAGGLMLRALIAVGLVIYLLMTLACAASIIMAVLTASQVEGMVASALVVFYAGETVELARWLRHPQGKPALHPTWAVPCAVLAFALVAGLALWVRGA